MSSVSWKRNIKGTYGVAYVDMGLINDKTILEKEIRVQLSNLDREYPDLNAKLTEFDINIPTNSDGLMYNHAYVYFSRWDIFNAFIGLNFDGTPRKKYNLGGVIKLEDLDPAVFDVSEIDPVEYSETTRKISAALNKITESSFENLKDIYVTESVKHPAYIKFTIERVFDEVKDLSPDHTFYSFKAGIFVAIADNLKQNSRHELFLKIMFYILKEREIDYKLFAFACLLVQEGMLDIEHFKSILSSLKTGDAYDYFTKAVKFTKGELWRKCGKKLKKEFEKFSKPTTEYGKRIEFAIDDLKKVMQEPLTDPDEVDDWMLESEVIDLPPLVQPNYFLLSKDKVEIMKENYFDAGRKNPQIPNVKRDTLFLSSFLFKTSYARPDESIISHNKLVGRNFPDWVTRDQVLSIFKKYSTDEGYPIVEIDNNKLSCYVNFSPDQAHFQDASFANQMHMYVKFTSGTRSATVKFAFMRQRNDTQTTYQKKLKPMLTRPPRRR